MLERLRIDEAVYLLVNNVNVGALTETTTQRTCQRFADPSSILLLKGEQFL